MDQMWDIYETSMGIDRTSVHFSPKRYRKLSWYYTEGKW